MGSLRGDSAGTARTAHRGLQRPEGLRAAPRRRRALGRAGGRHPAPCGRCWHTGGPASPPAPHRPAPPRRPLLTPHGRRRRRPQRGPGGGRGAAHAHSAPQTHPGAPRGGRAAPLRNRGVTEMGGGRDTGTWEGDGDTDWEEIWGRLGAGRLGRGGTGTWGGMGTGAWGKGTLGNGMGTGEQGRGQRHWEWGEEWGAGTLKAWGQAGGRETGNENRDMGRGARGGMGTGTRGQGHGEWGEDRDVGTQPGQDGDRDTGNGIGMGT